MNVVPVVTEDDNTDIIGLQVESHTPDTGSKLDHLSGLDFVQSNDSGNTITNTNDCTELFDIILNKKVFTTWVMFMILSWMTFAVSAMPSFLELNMDLILIIAFMILI